MSKVVLLRECRLGEQLVGKSGVAHQELLEGENRVEGLVTCVAERRMRRDGDLEVVEELTERGEGLATVTNARNTLALGLLEECQLELQDVELHNVWCQD